MVPLNIDTLFDELFPICRSICGDGLRTSLQLLKKHIPIEIHSIATGTQVFDWQIPQEWKLNHARLSAPNGEVIIDSNVSNLHVVNCSEPFSGEVELEELQQHLYSLPHLPHAIPYVTSYYQPRWGLCLPDEIRSKLKPGTYRVVIDTEKKDGFLNYGVCDLPGDSEELFVISTYLCHPSLANNELSGPLALLKLYEALKNQPSRRYTYRFIIVPETIGSIAYLAHHGEELKKRMVGGMVLTCLGGPFKQLNIKLTREHWVNDNIGYSIDNLAKKLAEYDSEWFATRQFSPSGGSDERQYCSPDLICYGAGG